MLIKTTDSAKKRIFSLLLAGTVFLTGCSGMPGAGSPKNSGSSGAKSSSEVTFAPRKTLHEFPETSFSGEKVYTSNEASIEASSAADGYVGITYTGKADGAKVQITDPEGVKYTYSLKIGSTEVFPLAGGEGGYSISVLEHAYDEMYAVVLAEEFPVSLNNEFTPFLYPNQYVWFEAGDECVALGEDISEESTDDLDYVSNVYNYVISHISYDREKAANISSGYLPDNNDTLASGKGICFDYASLMAAMLRSQGVPTKLIVGYSGTAYHAWISVYIAEIGWINNIIQFDGENWSLMDPTLAAGNANSAVGDYIGDGSNYTEKYRY